jgi:hypothetical protein
MLPYLYSQKITAPHDFTLGFSSGPGSKFQEQDMYYRDAAEAVRFAAIAHSKGPSGEIIRDLAASRNNCTKAAYMVHVSCMTARVYWRKAHRIFFALFYSYAQALSVNTKQSTVHQPTPPNFSA